MSMEQFYFQKISKRYNIIKEQLFFMKSDFIYLKIILLFMEYNSRIIEKKLKLGQEKQVILLKGRPGKQNFICSSLG